MYKRQLYTWIVYADDDSGTGITLEPAGKRYMGTVANQTVKEPDLTNPEKYSWSLIQGNEGEKGDDAVILYIDSSNGTTFKNTGVATILTVSIFVGGECIDTSAKMHARFGNQAYIEWQFKRQGETDFYPIPRDDKRLSDEGFIFTLNPQDVDIRTTINCNLIY